MSKFKIGLSIIFSVFIIIGVIVFAASKGAGSGPAANITVWGFIPKTSFDAFLQNSSISKSKKISISYVEKNKDNFQNDFINALANGQGPDVVMISQDMLLQNKNKLFVIPYANYNQRTFKDSFIQEGELFLDPLGVYAVPFTIDPLVMYWNRDIFNSASVATPPKYWDEFLTLPQKLSKTDSSGNFTQSTVALGGWSNVNNAKAILSDILLGAGTSIVDNSGAKPHSILLENPGSLPLSPAESGVNFFTQFSNPVSPTYSWNRAEDSSLSNFLSGNLAVYFGFASELTNIRAKNPNLNFDVAMMPQLRQNKKVVFGKMYGLSIVKQSKNIGAAYMTITLLTADDSLTSLEPYTNLPPVKRSLLTIPPKDAYQTVFYDSAIASGGWLDPDSSATDQIFEDMIESISSGRARVSEAIRKASESLNVLFQ